MSTSSWLQKQRKSELVELADSVGLKMYDNIPLSYCAPPAHSMPYGETNDKHSSDGLKKTDIETELEGYLKSNPSFSTDTRVAPFYKRRIESSPVKKEVSSTLSDGEKAIKSVKRRATKAAEELTNAVSNTINDDGDEDSLAARARTVARTPRASALAFAQSVPLPPSPSVVADAIDRRTAVIRRRVSQAYEDSGVMETAQVARESLSSVVSIEMLIILFEAYCLRSELLADRYAFTIPLSRIYGKKDYPVMIPDLFLLLTASFWGPATLWAFTSLVTPLVAAYFFNLTSKPRTGRSHTTHFNYAFDPLTFNIVKALLTYVVYQQDSTLGGLVDLEYVARINSALYGGPSSVLVGCFIGILVTFYEAIIKK